MNREREREREKQVFFDSSVITVGDVEVLVIHPRKH